MEHKPTSNAMHVLGALSAVCSMSMMLALVASGKLKEKLYPRVIFYIAMCDLLSGVAASFGMVKDRSALCWIQGIMTNIFPLAGVFWTTVLAYLLFIFVSSGKTMKELNLGLHLVCFALPVLLTLLPLTTNRYGARGDYGWCFVDGGSNSPEWSRAFWVITSFYFWIWAALLLFICLYIFIIFRLQHTKNELVKMSVNSITWYPLAVILCWSIPTMYDITEALESHKNVRENRLFFNMSFLSPVLQGSLNAVIFFSTNQHARDVLWKYLFCGKAISFLPRRTDADDEDDSDVVVITVISPPFATPHTSSEHLPSLQGDFSASPNIEFSSMGAMGGESCRSDNAHRTV